MKTGNGSRKALKSTRGIDLRSPRNRNPVITQDMINDLKLNTQKIELETRQLRSKTSHTKSLIRGHNNSLNGIASQSEEKQNIKTASQNTLKTLHKTVRNLEITLQEKKNELEKLQKSDKLAISEELQIEIRMLHLEKKRLEEQARSLGERESIIMGELNRLRRQTASTQDNEECIDRLQLDIDNLTEKLFAYSKNELRVNATKRLKKVYDHPEILEDERMQLEDEINMALDRIDTNHRLLDREQKKEEDNIAYLQSIIDEQAQNIQIAIEGIKNV